MAAISKLNILSLSSSSFPPQTLLPVPKSHLPHLSFASVKNKSPLNLHLGIQPITPIKISTEEEEEGGTLQFQRYGYEESDPLSVAFPSVAFSNRLLFSSRTYNVEVTVGEREAEDKLIGRFRREVLKAGVIQECKRRRHFETSQEQRKRKVREAAKRNRIRRRRPPASSTNHHRTTKEHSGGSPPRSKEEKEDDDNWEVYDVDLPYHRAASAG
ncbi:30S ribosomal protein S21, chloroplastic-like isoform X2 [Andrographis paniculata]|uniref:30S ribosomal protein S21, chloroplastic-like isoform X2 n=1 Tax=Andrographis paniculata TaxID=175694 RepID=UPI0021E8DEC9|nr:30S ribosomal protein S21, chloroplastic-like isoform X2 [Andrographis paniculata]